MTKKEKFIEFIEQNIDMNEIEDDDVALYWDALKNGRSSKEDKSTFTSNGKLVMKFLQEENSDVPMKSKDIAEQIGVSSRTVAGTMKKLVSENWVEAVGDSPKMYLITELGKNINID